VRSETAPFKIYNSFAQVEKVVAAISDYMKKA
jgi:hypothetical protein